MRELNDENALARVTEAIAKLPRQPVQDAPAGASSSAAAASGISAAPGFA